MIATSGTHRSFSMIKGRHVAMLNIRTIIQEPTRHSFLLPLQKFIATSVTILCNLDFVIFELCCGNFGYSVKLLKSSTVFVPSFAIWKLTDNLSLFLESLLNFNSIFSLFNTLLLLSLIPDCKQLHPNIFPWHTLEWTCNQKDK